LLALSDREQVASQLERREKVSKFRKYGRVGFSKILVKITNALLEDLPSSRILENKLNENKNLALMSHVHCAPQANCRGTFSLSHTTPFLSLFFLRSSISFKKKKKKLFILLDLFNIKYQFPTKLMSLVKKRHNFNGIHK